MNIGLNVFLFIIGSISLANAAPFIRCPYQSPTMQTLPYLQKIAYFDNNPPMCADDFLNLLRADKTDSFKNALWTKALKIAKKNVRVLHCDDGIDNVIFINKKVFLTSAHSFYSLEETTHALKERHSDQFIHHCYVMSGGKKNFIDISSSPNFGDLTVSPANDYAVGAVEDIVSDIEPVEMATADDFSKDQEVLVTSAIRNNDIGRNCFSVALCFDRRIWPAKGDLPSSHVTNCPSDEGASGSAEFLIKTDPNSKAYKIVLGHVFQGGSNPLAPNGRPYFYSKNPDDPNAAYGGSIGIDGIYREKIDAFVREIQKKNPPGSLDPQPHQQDAEYVPQGQSL